MTGRGAMGMFRGLDFLTPKQLVVLFVQKRRLVPSPSQPFVHGLKNHIGAGFKLSSLEACRQKQDQRSRLGQRGFSLGRSSR
jgi:hypothetical protein